LPSAVLIIPAALRAAANAVAASQGWGPDNYTVPLSATGLPPATHYMCRTDVSAEFLELVANPPPIPGVGAVIAALDMDLSEWPRDAEHAEAVMADRGLQRVWEGL